MGAVPGVPHLLRLECAILVLRSIKTGAGIAGKDFRAGFGVWPETANRLSTADLLQGFFRNLNFKKKTRWLLWLEDTSTDESRRAAAALRIPIAMLTKVNMKALKAPLHCFAASSNQLEKEHLDYRNS